MHATILRPIRDVHRLAGNPCTASNLIEHRILRSVIKLYNFSVHNS